MQTQRRTSGVNLTADVQSLLVDKLIFAEKPVSDTI